MYNGMGQAAFHNLRVVPPATGIVHQVNLEYLTSVVCHDNTTKDSVKNNFPNLVVLRKSAVIPTR